MILNVTAEAMKYKKVLFWFRKDIPLTISMIVEVDEIDTDSVENLAEAVMGENIFCLERDGNINEFTAITSWDYVLEEN